MINREGYYVTDTERECTNCGAIFKKTSKTVTICNKCNSERVKSNSPEWKMHQRAKRRAKELDRKFDLEFSDIVIPERCPILGIPLVVYKGRSGGNPNSPSLDRVNSSLGYTKDNIQVISHRANMMKTDANKEELLAFANWIIKYFST